MKQAQTSQQWWQEVSKDKEKLHAWLQKQHYGEVQASHRVHALVDQFRLTGNIKEKIETIAKDEARHAAWIKEILNARHIETLPTHEERYWKETMTFTDAIGAFAVAAHAEKMRLSRIEVIANDVTAPWDIREAFVKILMDEVLHEKIFRELTPKEEYERARGFHEKGAESLGLTL